MTAIKGCVADGTVFCETIAVGAAGTTTFDDTTAGGIVIVDADGVFVEETAMEVGC